MSAALRSEIDLIEALDGVWLADGEKTERRDAAVERFVAAGLIQASLREKGKNDFTAEEEETLRSSDNGLYSFVALDRPRDGESGDSYLVLYDYHMDFMSNILLLRYGDDPLTMYPYVDPAKKARPLVLAQGDIESFEMVQNLSGDKKTYTQSIFYVQKESAGGRNTASRASISPARSIPPMPRTMRPPIRIMT